MIAKVTQLERAPNQDAIDVLETALLKVRNGEIVALAVSWVGKDGSISGDISGGDNQILMWASLQHAAKSFYKDNITGAD